MFWDDDILEGNFEFGVSGVKRDFFDFVFSYVAGEGFLYFLDTVFNICIGSLGEHFYSTVSTVSDEAGQLMTVGYVKGSETKSNPLDPADENNMFCTLAHLDTRFSMLDSCIEHFNVNPKHFSVQGENFEFEQ